MPGTYARQYLKQESSALAVHAGFCGGAENRHSYREPLNTRPPYVLSDEIRTFLIFSLSTKDWRYHV